MNTQGGRYSDRVGAGVVALAGGFLMVACLLQGCDSEHAYTANLDIQVTRVSQNQPGWESGPYVPDPVGRRPTDVGIRITNNGDRDITRLSCAVTCAMMGVGHGQTKTAQPVRSSRSPLRKKGGSVDFTVTFSETIEHVSPAARIGMADVSVEVTDIEFAD